MQGKNLELQEENINLKKEKPNKQHKTNKLFIIWH